MDQVGVVERDGHLDGGGAVRLHTQATCQCQGTKSRSKDCIFQETMTDPPTDMRVYISTRQNYREGHNNGNKKIKLLVLNTLKPLV